MLWSHLIILIQVFKKYHLLIFTIFFIKIYLLLVYFVIWVDTASMIKKFITIMIQTIYDFRELYAKTSTKK